MRISETEIRIAPELNELECFTLGLAAGWYYNLELKLYEQRGGDPMDFVRLGASVWEAYANKLNIPYKFFLNFRDGFINAALGGSNIDTLVKGDFRAVHKAIRKHDKVLNDLFVELAPNKYILY